MKRKIAKFTLWACGLSIFAGMLWVMTPFERAVAIIAVLAGWSIVTLTDNL